MILPSVQCSFFDQCCDLLLSGYIDCVACARLTGASMFDYNRWTGRICYNTDITRWAEKLPDDMFYRYYRWAYDTGWGSNPKDACSGR